MKETAQGTDTKIKNSEEPRGGMRDVPWSTVGIHGFETTPEDRAMVNAYRYMFVHTHAIHCTSCERSCRLWAAGMKMCPCRCSSYSQLDGSGVFGDSAFSSTLP